MPRRTSGFRTEEPSSASGAKNGTYYAMNGANGRLVWETHLSPGSTFFGGALGSAAVVGNRIIASSN